MPGQQGRALPFQRRLPLARGLGGAFAGLAFLLGPQFRQANGLLAGALLLGGDAAGLGLAALAFFFQAAAALVDYLATDPTASGRIDGCLIFQFPDICSTTSLESSRTSR